MTIATSKTQTRQTSPITQDLEALRARIAGDVITRQSGGYDDARQLHDFHYDRRPLAIVRAVTSDDVAEAVRLARRHDYPLAVRSGGHSIPGYSMVDGGIVIDMSGMRAVTIDPAGPTARIQPGATSGDVAGPAHAYGLALSTGDASSVGIGGLTLGGGIGFMVRRFGLAIDNLLSVKMVTAEGEQITASVTEHADLFWALRGGGGNFGIVTEFEFRMAPVGQVLGGALVIPATPATLRGYLDYALNAPDDLTTITNVMHAPPAPFIPEERVGELVLMILVTWTGDPDEGQRVLDPLRALAEPVADAVSLIPYPVMYNFTEAAAAPHGAAVRSMFAQDYSDETIAAVFDAMENVTSPVSMVQFRPLGGAYSRIAVEDTAFAHRDKPHFLAVLGLWMDPSDDPRPHTAWTQALWEQVRADADGVYVNFLSDEGEERIRDAYPPETLRRLSAVKAAYDPDNVFRFNQNIRPKA